MKKVELLAPAGSFESFLGAIHAGADAVYIGGQKYGARAYAENFTEEQVCLAIRYAHLFGKKLYLTVNTLVKEEEIYELPEYIRPFYEAGLDGVIIQDMGVFALLRECFPGLELHGSTQMTITGAHGARFLLEQGASRVVPARELSLEEIKKIKDTGIEVEAFIHGAMCYCYSGQCLFSSMLGGRSGNRGRCAQPCRLPYQVAGKQGESYPLSLKDMCMLSFIPELIEAGIDSFKIEGRMKKPEYAAGVTALYRKYIDRYYAAPEDEFVIEKEDMENLRRLYIRSEIQEGYYFRHNGKEMITPNKPSYLGTDENYLKKIRELYLEHTAKIPITGTLTLKKGQNAMLEVSRSEVSGLTSIESGKHHNICICHEGQTVEAAQKQPLTEDTVRKQMMKTGNTPFVFQEFVIHMEKDVFLSVKALNDLRRDALLKLQEALTLPYCRNSALQLEGDTDNLMLTSGVNKTCEDDFSHKESGDKSPYLAVQIQQAKQLMPVLGNGAVGRIYLEADLLLDKTGADLQERLQEWKAQKPDRELFFIMPVVLRALDQAYLQQVKDTLLSDSLWDGVMVRNLESLQWLKEQAYKKAIIADAGLYTWNKWAKRFFGKMNIFLTAPLECNKSEWHKLGLNGMEIVIYGRALLMVSANCIRKTKMQCLKGKSDKGNAFANEASAVVLRDRYKTEFPVRTVCRHCYNEIYNSVPLSLHDYSKSVMSQQPAGVRVSFTIETPEEVSEVLDCYTGYTTETEKKRQANFAYTKGHYKRGAE